jgi:hypothetical protein
MFPKHLAALAALALTAIPCAAFETTSLSSPGVTFYFSVPLDAPKAKDRTFSAGFAIQGKRQHETVYLDSRLFNSFIGTGLEAKWIIAGVVAAGAGVAVASKDKSTNNGYQQAQAQQAKKKQQSGGGGGHDPNHPGHYPGDGCSACDPNHKP